MLTNYGSDTHVWQAGLPALKDGSVPAGGFDTGIGNFAAAISIMGFGFYIQVSL